MFDFVVIGKKDDDCYVIQDMREGMGGKCCVSRYTLMQLAEMGFRVLGIQPKNGKLGVHDVICYNVTGEVSTRINSYPSVEDTKRSASTVSKGLKLSRAEKKQRKETSDKRVKTLKTNKKEAEKAAKEAERIAKEEAKKKEAYKKYINSLKKTKQKSKPNFSLIAIEATASEYHMNEVNRFEVEMYSPAAITIFMKGLHNADYTLPYRYINETVDARTLNRELERRGCAKVVVEDKFGLDGSFKQYVIAAAYRVDYSFENNYEDYSFSCRFIGNTKQIDCLNCHHTSPEYIKERFGSTAGGEYSLEGLRKYLVGLGYF